MIRTVPRLALQGGVRPHRERLGGRRVPELEDAGAPIILAVGAVPGDAEALGALLDADLETLHEPLAALARDPLTLPVVVLQVGERVDRHLPPHGRLHGAGEAVREGDDAGRLMPVGVGVVSRRHPDRAVLVSLGADGEGHGVVPHHEAQPELGPLLRPGRRVYGDLDEGPRDGEPGTQSLRGALPLDDLRRTRTCHREEREGEDQEGSGHENLVIRGN